MKRLIFTLFVGLAVTAAAAVVSYSPLRVNGASTYAGGEFYLVCDSSDTFQVDTFVSDTFFVFAGSQDLSVANFLNLSAEITGFALADSANDSVVIISTAYTFAGAAPARAIAVDTFTTTLDSTEVLRNDIRIDSLVLQGLYFQTIVKDSFILGEGIDSTRLAITYHVLEKR